MASIFSRLAGLVGRRSDVAAPPMLAAAPYSGQPQGAPNVPPPNLLSDQPAAIVGEPEFRSGYHDHSFAAGVSVFSFGGFDLASARPAIEEHDAGTSFYNSARLSIAVTRFGPVYSALAIRTAPSIALPRKIDGGTQGLARIVAAEVEDQLCPRVGLLPSACFPSTLWGAMAIDLAMMGFFVLQHVYGPPDEMGRRRVYTRRWPPWAVRYDSWRRTYVAITTECNVDIVNDGKFTIGGKTDVPHLQGAIRAIATEALDGVQTKQARAQWISRYADPKLVGYMPPGVPVRSPEGLAFFQCLQSLRNPGGFGALPHGSELEAVGLDSKASASFAEALNSSTAFIYAILTGADPSAASGAVYKSPQDADILHATIGDDLAAENRAVNQGHVYPWTRFNHAVAIEEAGSRWKDPVLSTPLPDPKADARIEAKAKHMKAFVDQVVAEKMAGADITIDRIEYIAKQCEVEPFALAAQAPGAQSFAYDQENGVITINQRLEELGKPLDTTGRGEMTIPAYRAHLAAETERKKQEAEAENVEVDPAEEEAPEGAEEAA